MPLAAPAVPRGVDADSPLVVQVWNRDGVQVYRSQGGREAPARDSATAKAETPTTVAAMPGAPAAAREEAAVRTPGDSSAGPSDGIEQGAFADIRQTDYS